MVVLYAVTALVASLATVVLLWPFGAATAFAAAPFVASFAVLWVAIGVYATATRRRSTLRTRSSANADAA